MKNSIFAARTPSPLVRIWRSTGDPGSPIVCRWLQDESVKLRSGSVTDETGGSRPCA
jgi:hypothetical protein